MNQDQRQWNVTQTRRNEVFLKSAPKIFENVTGSNIQIFMETEKRDMNHTKANNYTVWGKTNKAKSIHLHGLKQKRYVYTSNIEPNGTSTKTQ